MHRLEALLTSAHEQVDLQRLDEDVDHGMLGHMTVPSGINDVAVHHDGCGRQSYHNHMVGPKRFILTPSFDWTS